MRQLDLPDLHCPDAFMDWCGCAPAAPPADAGSAMLGVEVIELHGPDAEQAWGHVPHANGVDKGWGLT